MYQELAIIILLKLSDEILILSAKATSDLPSFHFRKKLLGVKSTNDLALPKISHFSISIPLFYKAVLGKLGLFGNKIQAQQGREKK